MLFIIVVLVTVCLGGLVMFLFGKKKKPEDAPVEVKVDSAINDAEKNIAEFQRKIAELRAKRDEMEEDLKYNQEIVDKWIRMVEVAVSTKVEANVRTAVQSRMEAERPRDSHWARGRMPPSCAKS